MRKFILVNIVFILSVFSFINPNISYSDTLTLNTNVKDVIVKDFRFCWMGDSNYGTLVNRSNNLISGYLKFKYFDDDRDPIGSCSTKIYLPKNEGERIEAERCNCANGAYVLAEINLSNFLKDTRINLTKSDIANGKTISSRDKEKEKSLKDKLFDFFK